MAMASSILLEMLSLLSWVVSICLMGAAHHTSAWEVCVQDDVEGGSGYSEDAYAAEVHQDGEDNDLVEDMVVEDSLDLPVPSDKALTLAVRRHHEVNLMISYEMVVALPQLPAYCRCVASREA